MKLGGLEICDGWVEDDDVEVYKFVTTPEMDVFVPRPLQRHLMKDGFHYTDIIRYDPREIADPPYRLHVTSIPPILPSKVSLRC